MRGLGSEDHEVRHVHDANTKVGHLFTEEGGRSDHFEGDFDTNADENTIVFDVNNILSNRMEAATYTSGLTPSSVLANFQMDAPATQCLSASSGLSQTGVGCLLPTIKLT